MPAGPGRRGRGAPCPPSPPFSLPLLPEPPQGAPPRDTAQALVSVPPLVRRCVPLAGPALLLVLAAGPRRLLEAVPCGWRQLCVWRAGRCPLRAPQAVPEGRELLGEQPCPGGKHQGSGQSDSLVPLSGAMQSGPSFSQAWVTPCPPAHPPAHWLSPEDTLHTGLSGRGPGGGAPAWGPLD